MGVTAPSWTAGVFAGSGSYCAPQPLEAGTAGEDAGGPRTAPGFRGYSAFNQGDTRVRGDG